MNADRCIRASLPLLAALLVGAIAGCSKEETPVTPPPDPGGNQGTLKTTGVMTLDMQTTAGSTPFALLQSMTSGSGVEYRISAIKFFISRVWLVNAKGDTVRPKLLDSALAPMPYNVQLVDYEKPSTLKLRFETTATNYTALGFNIGIPVIGDAGDSLNHGDASTRQAPLDVDNGMYWSWNPGYIFFRIEGRANVNGEWVTFFYHVGSDERLMGINQQVALKVDTTNSSTATLGVDINRLFVDMFGRAKPDFRIPAERVAQSGPLATTVAQNIMTSGFITVKQ